MTISKLAHHRVVRQREGVASKRIASRVDSSSSPDDSRGGAYSSKTSRPCDPARHLASGVNSLTGSTSQVDVEAVMVLMPSYHAATQANYEQRNVDPANGRAQVPRSQCLKVALRMIRMWRAPS
jgi:hypothetical protein